MTEKSKKTDEEIFYPEGIDIKIAGEDFNIRPFVLKNRLVVLRIVGEVIKDYNAQQKDIKELNQGDMISLLITAAGGRLIDVYVVVLGKEKAWLEENVTLKDEFRILKAVSEVNDISFLLQQAKALTARAKI